MTTGLLLHLVSLGISSLGSSVQPRPPSHAVCPAEAASIREVAQHFLTAPAHQPSRTAVGVGDGAAPQLRLLTDSQDSYACSRLNEEFGASGQAGEWAWSYYTADGYYFVATKHIGSASGAQRVGFAPFAVYNASFQRVGGFLM